MFPSIHPSILPFLYLYFKLIFLHPSISLPIHSSFNTPILQPVDPHPIHHPPDLSFKSPSIPYFHPVTCPSILYYLIIISLYPSSHHHQWARTLTLSGPDLWPLFHNQLRYMKESISLYWNVYVTNTGFFIHLSINKNMIMVALNASPSNKHYI